MNKQETLLNAIARIKRGIEMAAKKEDEKAIEEFKVLLEVTEKQVAKKPIYSNKHFWKKDEYGDIDDFVLDVGYHNGPMCEVCGYSFCQHCEPEGYETTCDEGHYECQCGALVEENQEHCVKCGQALDWSGDDE